jgi:hypothetical protein
VTTGGAGATADDPVEKDEPAALELVEDLV